ncbi:MAG: hypothetical protein ACP5F6_08070 [Microbacter sp.]
MKKTSLSQWLKKFWKNNYLNLIGIVLGGIAGYIYWLKVGCTSGHCPITGSPVNSTIYGAILGWLFFSMFKPNKKKNHSHDKKEEASS